MEGPQFSLPPPNLLEPPPPDMGSVPPNLNMPPPNLSAPPPNMSMPPPNLNGAVGGYAPRFGNQSQQFQHRPFFRPFQPYVPRGPIGPMTLEDFDGKRLRKSVMRKTVDYNSAIIEALETRIWQRDYRDRRALQPDVMYYPEMLPPPSYPDNAMNCVCTRFVKTATNKMRCPIFCMAWTPEGRRLVTGASSGEFTLWNGLTFNFETILQAHDSPVRTMVWSHNDNWMVTGDHAGYVKYWQSNMNNVKMFQAHKEALRGISFSPTDTKFVTCSDDGTLRIWDFLRCHEERVLRGHGADVKCVHWHPQKGLVISGSKDNQQPIKLWDPKTGQSLATLHAHKSTVMDLKWNDNGNWLITASRDHLLKLFDLRNLSQEVQTFRGHKKEASNVAWHPNHEGLFASGGSDGAIMFWHVGADKEVGAIEQAHDSIVWRLAWHPLGHILCSGSNDHSSKFWTRNRPGDTMRDKYNLNTLPAGLSGLDDADIDEPSVIPGMGPEDRVEISLSGEPNSNALTAIPGLDLDTPIISIDDKPSKMKKVPYSKPIPRNFQAQWNDTGNIDDDDDGIKDSTISEVISHIVENTPGVVPLKKIAPSAIIVYGKCLPVEPGSVLEQKIAEGPEALKRYIASGAIEELHDVMPHEDEDDYLNDEYSDNDTNIPTLSVTNVKLPPPLPSSKLAKSIVQSNQSNIQNQAIQNQLHIANQEKLNANNSASKSERPRKSRFSDLNDSSDQDMRNYVTTPTRVSGSNSLESLIRSKDQDMRYSTGSSGNSSSGQDSRLQSSAVQDEDLRQNFSRDPDFRNSGGSHNFSSGFNNMRRDELRSEQSQNSPKRTRFESPNQNQSSRSNERQDDNWQSQQNRHPWEMDSQGIGTFSNHNQGSFNLNSESNQNSQFTQSNQIPNLFSQTQTNPFSQNSQFNQNDSPNNQQNFMMNQNGGPFGNMNFGGQGPNNYRQSGSGPNFRPPFPHNNFRAEGPPGHWGPPRPDGFRGGRGGGYGPRGPPIRGGQRNFQGNNVRGRGPLRGANKGPMRGRNTFN